MAEESCRRGTDGTGCQAPEGHCLCANNCGFFGSPTTLNLCSKCYRDYRLKEEQASSAKAAVEKSFNGAPATAPAPSLSAGPSAAHLKSASFSSCVTPSEPSTQQRPNRCCSAKFFLHKFGFGSKPYLGLFFLHGDFPLEQSPFEFQNTHHFWM
ncbi:Zinc finger A20 and AN1 domain-containing stress-associated protein 4 [Nymphaea thermarum]|nr:Zinc finger A20 and AN1 domain-containing stress-associated protein 4 [Nymphaea thermarum]